MILTWITPAAARRRESVRVRKGREKSGIFPFGTNVTNRDKCRLAGSGPVVRNPMPELGGIGGPKDVAGLFLSSCGKIAPGV